MTLQRQPVDGEAPGVDLHEPRIISVSLVNTSYLEVEACHHDLGHQYFYYDLDACLGISEGSFLIGGHNFSKQTRRVRLAGASLIAEIPAADGRWFENTIGLDVQLPPCDASTNEDYSSHVALKCGNVIRLFADQSNVIICGWSLWFTSISAYLVYRSPGVRRYVDLNGKIGNRNGKFSTRARDFARHARNASLNGTILTAELRAPGKTWTLDHIDVGKFMTPLITPTENSFQCSLPASLPSMQNSLLYQPLDQDSIRLCQIIPGTWDALVSCTLAVHETASLKLPYCCLSYVWGDTAAAAMVTISVNGHEQLVSENLYKALRRLRLHRKEDLLWIDALCINQDDLAEKSVQVARMRDTYFYASSVLIWLGEDQACSTLRSDSGNIQDGSLGFLLYQLCFNLALDVHAKDIPGIFDQAQRRGPLYSIIEHTLTTLGNVEWFHRQWTVQEVTVAQEADVLCGSFEMNFAKFQGLFLRFWNGIMDPNVLPLEYTSDGGSLYDSFIHGVHWMINLDYLRRAFVRFINSPPEEQWQPALIMLCESHGGRRMMDRRDAVFATLPLTPLGFGRNKYHIDYTLDVEKVYQGFTFRIMETSQTYEVWDLVFYDDREKPRLSLSSWAINWYCVGMQGERVLELQRHPLYDTYAKIKASPRLIENENVLVVQGYIFDEISTVSPHTWGEGEHAFKETLRDWLNIVGPDTLWKIMTAGHTKVGAGKYRQAEPQDEEVWLRWASSLLEDSWKVLDAEKPMFDTVYNISYRRSLIQSAKGYLGLGWPLMRVGDVLCMIKGARFPYALRRREHDACSDRKEGKDLYELVGPCTYILGLQETEGVSWVERTENVYIC